MYELLSLPGIIAIVLVLVVAASGLVALLLAAGEKEIPGVLATMLGAAGMALGRVIEYFFQKRDGGSPPSTPGSGDSV